MNHDPLLPPRYHDVGTLVIVYPELNIFPESRRSSLLDDSSGAMTLPLAVESWILFMVVYFRLHNF